MPWDRILPHLFPDVNTRGRPIIGADIKHFTDIGHFKNRFADNFFFLNFLCKQTYYLQVTLFISE